MNEAKPLPGFEGITSQQLDENRLALRNGAGVSITLDRSEYDSDPEFLMEVTLWARRHGRELRR